jgi:hypothetical protein
MKLKAETERSRHFPELTTMGRQADTIQALAEMQGLFIARPF